ncbi:hypothetical protein L6452_27897 [Arctium lappa]|uniref:Uncharacterized protein n=1 Tax=Arctium lappa TaxID=4217 RepID=A0ACB8ZWT0_ARCLA|nr:hypothetical protein L6452_27897 [Arctium lappa]
MSSTGKHSTAERKQMINNKDLEPIILIPRIIVDGKEIVPEIPRKEAEQDRLKYHNSELLKQIQELEFDLSNSDKTSDCIKCTNTVKSYFADRKITKLQSQLKKTEQKSSELKDESVELQNKFNAFEEKISALEIKNAELIKIIQADKEKSDLEKSFTQQISEISKKTLQEKKDLELRCIKLSKQVSDFVKIIIAERDIFAKEKQVLETKFTELPKQISTLQDLLEKERQIFKEKKQSYELEKKNAEKRNTGIFKDISEKTKNLETYFDFYVKSLGKNSKKNQMVWRVKSFLDEEKKNDKASASTTKAKKNNAHKGGDIKKSISKTNGEDNPEEIILKVQDNSDAYYVSETDSEDDSRKFVFLKTDQRLQR